MNEISDDLLQEIDSIENTENNHTPEDALELVEKNEIITDDSDPAFVMASVKRHIDTIIDRMQDGERMAVGDMAYKVAYITGLKISIVRGFVGLLVKANPSASVELGRTGGIVKGGKKQHVDGRPRCETCHQLVKQTK